MRLPLISLAAVLVFCSLVTAGERAWQPAKAPLMSRWAKDVSPEQVLPEYPRPQLARKHWQNLNGLWQLREPGKGDAPAGAWRGVLVPFPIESALSGVGEHSERVEYRREFNVPQPWRGQRVLLHFGAVDWQARVAVNGKPIGEHRGGYDPFTFDITDALNDGERQELTVQVDDPTDAGTQPHGKQHLKPEGIWYTPTTGIWQTVWLEPVPASSIEKLELVPDVDGRRLRVTAGVRGAKPGQQVEAIATAGGQEITQGRGEPGQAFELEIKEPKLWSPDDPFLYDLAVRLVEGDRVVDEAASYFGMRKIELKQVDGITRIALNGEPLFEVGPLDQGFWPDGLYTAPTEAALKYDIEITKRLGYNMTRKHVKVEPERWYYWCDKLGLLVWQDMPHAHKAARGSQQFETELTRMVDQLSNHPSIVMWVVFNEGWGQHKTETFTPLVKQLDPSRLVSNASGWTDKRVGDILDIHVYPGPSSPKPESNRAAVLGEFGGLGLAVKGHTLTDKAWSYRGTEGSEQLTFGYVNLLRQAWRLRDNPGMSAAVYTQLTDVEGEINGLLTYDREVMKVDVPKIAAANRGDFPRERDILATAQKSPAMWQYTTSKPADDWFKPEFKAAGWREGPAGFGTETTPGGVVRTVWNSGDIWLRREVDLNQVDPARAALLIHHDENAAVYINGALAAETAGFTTAYEWLPLSAEGRAALRDGKNTIAVHCKQTGGGQYIDVGIVELDW